LIARAGRTGLPTMETDAQKPYGVEIRANRFEVRDSAGRAILTCGDQGSAVEYATLLNEAYQRGYKAGYRQARSTQAPGVPSSRSTSHLRGSP
jgi:hypothetical protein